MRGVSVLKIVPSFLLSFLIACGAGVQVSYANEDNPAGQQGTYSGVDMVFSPGEVGDPIEYTPEQVVSDISWTDIHPIKQVYMTCDCNTGQKMWDTLPVIQAVEGDGVFSLSARGTVSITWSAETFFTPSPTGNCRYQLPGTAEWVAQILEKIRRANRQR
jgi:hypothetical protein